MMPEAQARTTPLRYPRTVAVAGVRCDVRAVVGTASVAQSLVGGAGADAIHTRLTTGARRVASAARARVAA